MKNIFSYKNWVPVVGHNGADGIIRFGESEFFQTNDRTVKLKTGEEHDLVELLTKEIDFSWDGPLHAYANFTSTLFVEIQLGIEKYIRIEELIKILGLPDDYVPFAFKFPAGLFSDDGLHPVRARYINDVLHVVSSAQISEALLKIHTIFIEVYAYKNLDKAWQYVLYESLRAYSDKEHRLALVLLVSSMDILTKDMLFNEHKPKIRQRFRQISNLADNPQIRKELKKLAKRYETYVQKIRNSFEHDNSPIDINSLQLAYGHCFEIFWLLSELTLTKPSRFSWKKLFSSIKALIKF